MDASRLLPASQPSQRKAALGAILCGGLIMGAALGIRHVQGLFLIPMTLERGWPREAFGFAMALQNLCWGLAQPFAGMLADRFGSARVIAAGVLVYLAGLAMMAFARTPFDLALGGGLVIGIALACTTFGTVYGALSRLVPAAQRGWALGLAGSMGGLGMFVMVPLTQELQHWIGWSMALVVLGCAIAVLLPAGLKVDDSSVLSQAGAPGAASQSMGQAIREAFGHRGFWLLNIGFLACGFQLAFIAGHLPAYLLDKGLGPREGVIGLAIIALANVASMYVFGSLGGIYRRKYLLALLYLARVGVIAMFLLLPVSPGSVYLFCALIGFLWLGAVPLTNGIVSGVFGVRYLTTLFGFVFFGHQLGGFLGVWLGARIYDATHSYQPIWIASMCLGIGAAALHVFIDDEPLPAGGRLALVP